MRPTPDLVVAAALPAIDAFGHSQSHLDYILSKGVDSTYFQGPHQWLWKVAIEASLFTSTLDDVMVAAMLDQYGVVGDDKQKAMLLFLDLHQETVSRDKIKVVLPVFIEQVHAERLACALEDAARILTDTLTVDKEALSGYKDTRKYLMQTLSHLDGATAALPSKNIRVTVTEFLDEYSRAKNDDTKGIMTGFKQLDELTNGIQRGELFVACGYTGEGKSQLMHNMGYNACVQQGKNVVLVSLEMPVDQLRRRTFVRHTNHPMFGRPGGVFYEKVKRGSCNIDEEKVLFDAANDFATNPAYGKYHVLQMGKQETVPALQERLIHLRSRDPIDLLIVDYASLMSSVRRRQNRQDEIIEVIEGLKALALVFNDGEGLAMVTANQISRKAKEEADQQGRYGINYASETSAVEKTADLQMWILRTDDMKLNHEAKVGVSKYRDGAASLEFTCVEHFASGLLCDLDDAEAQIRF